MSPQATPTRGYLSPAQWLSAHTLPPVARAAVAAESTPIFAATCTCTTDDQLDRLRDLINNEGLDQWEASRIAFGHTPEFDAPRQQWKAWCHEQVRLMGLRVRTELGLPLVDEPTVTP